MRSGMESRQGPVYRKEEEPATYRVFGFTLQSTFPFASRLAPGTGVPDLILEWEVTPLAARPGELVYSSPDRLPTGESAMELYRAGDALRLEFGPGMEFRIERDRIRCQMAADGERALAEVRLLGTVFSLWLEWQGAPALHASAVEVEGRAVGFLAGNRAGKSSLAAAFLQAGCPLLTDDILPFRSTAEGIRACAGYPQMRFWPEDARRLLGSAAGLAPVLPGQPKLRAPVGEGGFGRFRAEACPVGALYLPERAAPGEATEVRIEPLPAQSGLIELLRHAFTPRMADALGLSPARLALFTRLLREAPLRRLRYPHGHDHLARVQHAIRADLLTPACDS